MLLCCVVGSARSDPTHETSLFSIVRVLGASPKDTELNSYLEAYFGDRLSEEQRSHVISETHRALAKENHVPSAFGDFLSFLGGLLGTKDSVSHKSTAGAITDEASSVASLLAKSTEEMDSIVQGLDGGYIKPAPGGGKSIHSFACLETQFYFLLTHTALKTCSVTDPLSFRLVETFTRWILIVCLRQVRGLAAKRLLTRL